MTSSSTIPYHPLTTVFTPPASCLVSTTDTAGITNGLTGINRGNLRDLRDPCYEFGYYDWRNAYSPGMCPYGYTTGYTSIVQFSITGARCCPSGLNAYNGLEQPFSGCYSIYTTSTSVKLWKDGSLTSGVVGPGIVTGMPYIVYYQSSDLSLFPAGYTPGKVISSTDGSQPITGSSNSITSSGPSNTNSGSLSPTATTSSITEESTSMSTGAKIGVGVGVSLALIAVVLLGLWILRRRRQRKAATRGTTTTEWNGKPELEASSKNAQAAVEKSFVVAPKAPAEMTTEVEYHELPGSDRAFAQLDSNALYEASAGKPSTQRL